MIDQKLINYIKKARKQNLSDGNIRKALISAGWEQEDINEGLKTISKPEKQSFSGKLPGPGALLKDTWVIYRSRIGIFLAIALIPVVLSTLINLLFQRFLNNTSYAEISSLGSIVFIVLMVVSGIIVSLINSLGQASLIFAVKDEKLEVIGAYKQGWRKFISFWVISILVGLVVFSGFMLLVIPGILFSIWFSLSFFVLINEDIKGMGALLKSKEYVRGNWWGVLGRFIFIGFIFFVVYFILGLILGIINIEILSQALNLIIPALLGPLVTIYGFLIYRNLKNQKGDFEVDLKDKKKFIIIIVVGIILFIAFTGLFIRQIYNVQNINFRQNFWEIKQTKIEDRIMDAQKISSIQIISSGLENYYKTYNTYPERSGCTKENWNNVVNFLEEDNYLPIVFDTSIDGDFVYSSDGKSYVLRVSLGDINNAVLSYDVDGSILGCDCVDPFYCVKSSNSN